MGVASTVRPISGTLEHFTLSPKGVPEGLIVRLDGTGKRPAFCQVNFDPELAGQVGAIVVETAGLTLEVVPFADAVADTHSVYDLVRLTTADGRSVVADGRGEQDVDVKGIVVRLNYARRGEVNGAILDTGDFLHLRPHGVKAVGLKVGASITASGEVKPGWSGRRVIEVRTANGVDIPKPPKPHPKPHHDKDHHGPKHHDSKHGEPKHGEPHAGPGKSKKSHKA